MTDVLLCTKEEHSVYPTDAELIHDGMISLDEALSNFMELKDHHLRLLFESTIYGLITAGEKILENLNGDE